LSLKGSIEDLPLLEILQVVAFCQKTGHLTVRAPEGDAGVIFREGRVVSGYLWDTPSRPPSPTAPGSEQQVRGRISAVLERLVRLREGQFAFNLTEQIPTRLGDRDLTTETLADGINPEEMMLDLARKLDEDRRDGAATLEATFSAPIEEDASVEEGAPIEEDTSVEEGAPAAEAEAAPARQEAQQLLVLLVDDEADVCRVVGRELSRAGYRVAVAGGLGHARREMARLAAAGQRFLLVADLGLPSESGTSFRGGLDVVRHASELATPPPVLLMAESFNEKLRARARRLGVSLVAFKPGLSKLDPRQYEADLRAFGGKLAKDLLPRLAERRTHAGAPAKAWAADDAERSRVLRAALEAIAGEPDPDLVSLQLLRAARSFFPRAILFVAKDDRLRGVAGFGAVQGPDALDVMARSLSIALDEPSPFAEAVASGRPWADTVPSDGPVRRLLERLGGFGAAFAAIVPVRAWRDTVAILYADGPAGVTLPPLEPFLAFVERAGQALEASLLARRAPQAVSC
jgi:CheY-like chemotaxis protein